MPPHADIDRQVSRQPGVSLLGVLERHRISPFLAEVLDAPLVLAPGADVLEPQNAAGLVKRLGGVGRAIVAQHLTAIDALAVEPGHCSAQEANCSGSLLVSENLHIGEQLGVIDGHVVPVVAEAGGTALAGDALPHLAEPGQFFDVDVNQARYLAFITLHHRLGPQVVQPPQAKAAQDLGHVGDAGSQHHGDMTQVHPLVASIHQSRFTACS